jgi:hypothetical protein
MYCWGGVVQDPFVTDAGHGAERLQATDHRRPTGAVDETHERH